MVAAKAWTLEHRLPTQQRTVFEVSLRYWVLSAGRSGARNFWRDTDVRSWRPFGKYVRVQLHDG
jgi:hypothetical protein